MVVPTTCARAAVRLLHTDGAARAKLYLLDSTVGAWANHDNPSMASGAQAVLDGLDWYVSESAADGRRAKSLDEAAIVSLAGVQVAVRLDVVLEDGDGLAARAILWDGPDLGAASGPVMACAFAHGLRARYPNRPLTTVGVWQARRQRSVEVSVEDAIAAEAAAGSLLASM